MFSHQGISDRVARSYMERHGTASWSEIEAALRLPVLGRCPLAFIGRVVREIEFLNGWAEYDRAPNLQILPLPSGAQFLNVIESVFSGMARAIIHNSDYPSVERAKAAIDRHFAERNRHFRSRKQKAGRAIWGREPAPATFLLANNCKDPKYQ